MYIHVYTHSMIQCLMVTRVSYDVFWLDIDLSTQTESPQIVSVNATSSTQLLVSWDRPNLDEMDGALDTFSVSCSPGDDNTVLVPADSLSADSLSAELLDLSPYTTYTCCVTAHTTAGVSGASCGTQTTLDDGVSVCLLCFQLCMYHRIL